jgi:hypothetical protein
MDHNGLHFEKFAFINVFHSNMFGSILLRFSRGRRFKVCKLRKLLHVLGNCLNNVQFYFENKININFGGISLYYFNYL